MRSIAGSAFSPQAMRGFQKDITAALVPLVERLQGVILSAATATGTDEDGNTVRIIPLTNQQRVFQTAGDMVQRFFVGNDYRSPFGDDGVSPLAEYPRILNYWLAWVTYKVVQKQSAFMKRNLPADVEAWLTRRLSREIISQNPLAEYDSAHTWVDPRGYQLSDRIWQTSIETRRKIDLLLADGIRTGRSALAMAKDLEAFLLPDRAGLKTNKPYGTKASYDAMRLSRSEIARAHSEATYVSALSNPFVDGWDWALSARHPKFDVCDGLATIGMSGQRVREPYPLDGKVPIVVVDSHPNCICTNRTSVSATNAEVIADLREMMGSGTPAPISPIDVWDFIRLLLGAYLTNLLIGEIGI